MLKGIAFGLCLFVAGLLCLDTPSNAQLTMMGVGGGFGIAAPSGSAWGDHGTNVTISTTSIANDTATGVANSFSSVRGTQAYSTGKHYFEIKVLTAPAVANFEIGVMDDTTANGAAMDDEFVNIPKSCGNLMFNGSGRSNGVGYSNTNIGSSWSLANNDVMAIAVDHTNGFAYLALNNVWFLSGDPTSGATGTGHLCNGALVASRPAIVLWGIPAFSGTMQLRTSTFTYTLPSGYSAWNYLLKRDMPNAANDNNTPMWMEQVA